ncbi:MAG: sigma-70 family RNA polymerase sigma factor [Cyclobacteriaceae bacterium]
MPHQQLIPHLFRSEFSKIVSVLCKTFGLPNIQWAEDIVSETFLLATETWGLKGTPDNPSAWLYKVARNKALDSFRREDTFRKKVKAEVEQQETITQPLDIDLSDHNIQDSQLSMLFAVCHPLLSREAQIALALKILCGFGVTEIAHAFLSNKETIQKRIQRAKAQLRQHQVQLLLPPPEALPHRLDNVLRILYLLFNEGYYSSANEKRIRKELCLEAMRLILLLLNAEATCQPETNALMALCCFHASRFEARENERGEQILYLEQNRADWDYALIRKGEYYLHQSGQGAHITRYHLEAVIAYWHTQPVDTREKWENILQMYNRLLQLEYSPVAALNRTYALAKANGHAAAIKEALKINLKNNHLFHLLLAELYQPLDAQKQREHLTTALALVETENEKKIILQKLQQARHPQDQ